MTNVTPICNADKIKLFCMAKPHRFNFARSQLHTVVGIQQTKHEMNENTDRINNIVSPPRSA
jgi:hypothetical protein